MNSLPFINQLMSDVSSLLLVLSCVERHHQGSGGYVALSECSRVTALPNRATSAELSLLNYWALK